MSAIDSIYWLPLLYKASLNHSLLFAPRIFVRILLSSVRRAHFSCDFIKLYPNLWIATTLRAPFLRALTETHKDASESSERAIKANLMFMYYALELGTRTFAQRISNNCDLVVCWGAAVDWLWLIRLVHLQMKKAKKNANEGNGRSYEMHLARREKSLKTPRARVVFLNSCISQSFNYVYVRTSTCTAAIAAHYCW